MKALWFERIWKGRSKGVSTVVGTVFLMLIIFMVSTNVLLWSFSRNAEYNQAVMEKNQEEADRIDERVIAFKVGYYVDEDEGKVKVEARLENAGSLAARIINMWVLDTTTQRFGFNETVESLNLNLKPGDILNLTGSNGIVVSIDGVSSSDAFNSWFVTARGNTVPLEEDQMDQSIIVADLSRGVGYLALEFDEFRYFTYESPHKLGNYPSGTLGFDVPKGEYVAFGCLLTNLDPLRRTIVIDAHSLFWQPGRAGIAEGYWFIVNVEADGTINEAYSSVAMNYQDTKMLVFASDDDLDIGSFTRQKTPNAQTTVATFLVLHGTLGSGPYAQSIPFVSLFYY
ncbi:MAG: hypothetical protein JSV85_05300 [Candidatus Bathyarchaeota archaeon]|nr:MAG: hypothetical protein JSV85_05300 [Candidatus Bathyarchaeota archaeon]